MDNGYVNGYIERKSKGVYLGSLSIEGIDISPITGVYFKQDNENYLWLKRQKILEYDDNTMVYKERDARPKWECYLKKQLDNNAVAYKGEFYFLRFRFSIVGMWDNILGVDDKHQRLNLFVERLPMTQQTIINSINKRKRDEQERRRNKGRME